MSGILDRVLKTGEQQSGLEFRHNRKNGSWFWASNNLSPVKNELGEVVGFQGIIQDIRRSQEAELAFVKVKSVYKPFSIIRLRSST
jgi:PAS domain S-box-containing protein